jgi:hypothetical protein
MATTSPHPEHGTPYWPVHRPRWRTYAAASRGAWFGFEAMELDGLPSDFLLIPLADHTVGHCAVAARPAP